MYELLYSNFVYSKIRHLAPCTSLAPQDSALAPPLYAPDVVRMPPHPSSHWSPQQDQWGAVGVLHGSPPGCDSVLERVAVFR
ncbi:hypothetical protein E2C01_046858 [Portunus trituberculatus]|uniref:Uncharacterized protein n=1 Tax=Portunus trituberculatus TaxID=210409 RepID=A0A5B7G679_PORTR|nr:hypothetical protein [Portunus trituberculatus]